MVAMILLNLTSAETDTATIKKLILVFPKFTTQKTQFVGK